MKARTRSRWKASRSVRSKSMPAVSPCAAASLPCQKRRFLASVLPFRRSRCYQPRRETVSMRSLPFALLAAGLLAGCAGGNIADRIGPTAGIVTEQLTRYGLDLGQTRCVSEALADRLTPLQMRRLERGARAVTQGYYEPRRLTVRDLTYVASTMQDAGVERGLVRATVPCDAVKWVGRPVGKGCVSKGKIWW